MMHIHRSRYPERRHTVRITLQIPLKVRCQMPEGEAIDFKAFTQFVSANGALIVMDTPLLPGQTIRLFNEMTAESVECFVTSVREKQDRRFIGVGFATPKTDFWHVVFPRAGTRQQVRSAQTGSLVQPETGPIIPSQS
ncbi:MAG TPA: PilZ domain-containing protein [Candidatus Acidoferrum sp.]|nr:PilZ domain-containing protein [Candidatus Acidoferrum sp.]